MCNVMEKAKPDGRTVCCREGKRDKLLGEYSVLDDEVASIPIFIKPDHEGNLECVAKGQSNPHIKATVSNTHYLRVIGGSRWHIWIIDLKTIVFNMTLNRVHQTSFSPF